PQDQAQEPPEGLLAQEGTEAADAAVSEGPPAEDAAPTEMQADANTTLDEADAQVVAEGQAEQAALNEAAEEGVSSQAVADAAEASAVSEPPSVVDVSDGTDVAALGDEGKLATPLDASTEDLVKQAFEAGYAAAKAELGDGSEQPNDGQPSPESEDAAYLRGLEEGQRQAKDELEAEVLLAADDLKALANQLAQAARDTETFYQPLLKLSMHLAEQLVRGELTLSGQAITRLVERCLSEFQQETSAPIVVRMNPADHERHLAYGAMAPKNMDLRPDPSLSSGSVRVSMNGAMIEDLIEHRRQALWDALMSAAATPDDDLPDSFLRNVAIVKEAMASVDDESTQPPAL
ncbi:MAG: FliH/SctL family protein, partial [Burkholderiaceae bacterium]